MRHHLLVACACSPMVAAPSTTAQDSVVVPTQWATVEAPATAFWALAPFEARQQLLLGPTLAAPLAGHGLRALAVRRNGDGGAGTGGRVHVQLWLSHGATLPLLARSTFAANRGFDHTKVFDGWISLPDAPPSSAPAPWHRPHAATLAFGAPFSFSGGPLCIETVTRPDPASPPWWPIDAVHQRPGASVSTYGSSCIAGGASTPATAQPSTFAIGGTAVFALRAPASVPRCLLLLGSNNQQLGGFALPLDLTPYGAPGCVLLTDSLAQLPGTLRAVPTGSGLAVTEAGIPPSSSLAGKAVYAQYAVLDAAANALGATFSNGVQATVGTPAAAADVTWLEASSATAAEGRRTPGRMPVLRIDT